MRSRQEIDDELDKTMSKESTCMDKSYIDGVQAALEWVIEDIEEAPMTISTYVQVSNRG